jgi:hypothetical protein
MNEFDFGVETKVGETILLNSLAVSPLSRVCSRQAILSRERV